MDTVKCTANIAYKRTTFQNKKPSDGVISLNSFVFHCFNVFGAKKFDFKPHGGHIFSNS